MRQLKRLLTDPVNQAADWVLLPECCNYRRLSSEPLHVETIPGPTTKLVSDIAKHQNQSILIGSIFEKSDDPQKAYNTSILINADGEIVATYRKIHLFDATIKGIKMLESNYFIAGQMPCVTEVCGVKTGLSICYDLRFSELYHRYAKQDVSFITVPSSFTSVTGKAHWETLLRARAIESQAFVLAPNQFGLGSGKVETYGHSMVIDPWGDILAKASSDKEEICSTTIDLNRINDVKEKMPCHQHRKL